MHNISSIYIHIPFCKTICSYCDFCKLLYNEEFVSKYLIALEKEINNRYGNDLVKTLYIGGGSPSSLSKKELNKLMNIIKIFKFDYDYEFTFECNINDINEELLSILKTNKVNRLSIGIESFDKENLKLMNRFTSFEDVLKRIKLCREYGFDNLNLDLMYALPNETLKVVKNDLKLLLKLTPDHISTYSLIMNKNTKIVIDGYQSIEDEKDEEMYFYILKKLKKKGYNHYEVSNFAKEGKESIHNLTYWNNQEYYGFGLASSGYIDGIRYTNIKNLTKYLNGDYDGEKEILSKEDKMEDELMLGLRKMKGLNIKDFQNKYDQDIFNTFPIKEAIKKKELMLKKDYLYVNPSKIYLMDEILIKLI